MKFTKEEAIKALEAKIPAKDKDLDLGRTIREAVENGCEMIGEQSEMELDVFVDSVFKTVKTAIGLAHKENSIVANRLQEQITKLEKELQGTREDKDNKKTEPELQALLDRISALEADKTAKDKASKIGEIKKQISEKMNESNVKDKEWVASMLDEIFIDENTDADAKAKGLVELYNKFKAKTVTKQTPGSAGGDKQDSYAKDTFEAAKALMKQKKAMMGQSVTEV